MSTAEDDKMTTEIPLSPEKNQETENTDGNDSDVDELLDELHQPTEAELAVQQLKESTSKLTNAIRSVGSDIDSKLHITDGARTVDSQLGVSKTVSNTASTIGSLWNKLGINEKAQNLMNQETVKNVSNQIGDTIDKTGIKDVLSQKTREIQELDEEHKISTKAAGTVSAGIDWVAGVLQTSSDNERAQGN